MPSKKPPKNCPAALRHHNIRLKTFLKRNKQYNILTVGSFIFFPPRAAALLPPPFGFIPNRTLVSSMATRNSPIGPARLLLLQRADTERMFLDLWDVPGGGSELASSKILDLVANKTFDQTGLHLKKFVRQISDGVEFKTSDGPGFMLCFEIEVKEVTEFGEIEKFDSLGDLKIELVRADHHEFVWATEEEIRDEIFPVATPEHKAVMLQAFERRRQDVEEMKERAMEACRVQKHTQYEEDDVDATVTEDDDEVDAEEEDSEEDEKKADEGPDYGKVSVKHNRIIKFW